MHFFAASSVHLDSFALFSLIVLLGLIGGECIRRNRFLPQILGYIAVGFLIGPHGLNIVNESALAETHFFVEISLGLILFQLGRHLDFTWLRHDPGLLLMSLTESGLTFGLIFAGLLLLGLPWLPAALAATVAIATSPAVVMMIVNDLSAHGPITRRALILTSLNNLVALTLFTLLLPAAQLAMPTPHATIFTPLLNRLIGSLILGLFMFGLTLGIAYLIGKRKESQFVLLIGAVTLAISLSYTLHFSTMLALFWFGVAARNLDRTHILMEIDFGWLARLFFILLFVVTGIHLQLQGLWQIPLIVMAFLGIRFIAKMAGIYFSAGLSRLTRKQALAIGLALMPISGVGIGMSYTLINFNPQLGQLLMAIIATAATILNIIGPIATQFALVSTGEAVIEE